MGILRTSRLVTYSNTFLTPTVIGANLLLLNEGAGYAVDATTAGGTVTVKDQVTPANNLSNVSLDVSNITQAGTSPKMVIWNDSFIRWTPHNLFLNSGSPATQTVTLVSGFIYTFGVVGSGSLAGSGGASGTATAGNPVTFTASAASCTFTITGSLTRMQLNRGRYLTNYLVTTGAAIFGIPQGFNVTQGIFGMLIEPAATNLFQQTENLNTPPWFQALDAGLTSNAAVAPDGANVATLLYATNNAVDKAFVDQAVTGAAGQYTLSVFVKANSWQWFQLSIFDGTNDHRVWYDLTNGVIGTIQAGCTATMQRIGNDWYRVSNTFTVSASNPDSTFEINDADNTTTTTANGTNGVYLWGVQMEAGPIATSYIPNTTTVASVTRGVDTISATTTSIPFSTSVGASIFYGSTFKIINPSPGSNTELADFIGGGQTVNLFFSTTPDLRCFFAGGGASAQPSVNTGLPAAGVAFKGGAVWANLYTAICLNGGTLGTDAALAPPPSAVTNVQFGRTDITDADMLNGFMYQYTYLPRRITNVELQTKTT